VKKKEKVEKKHLSWKGREMEPGNGKDSSYDTKTSTITGALVLLPLSPVTLAGKRLHVKRREE